MRLTCDRRCKLYQVFKSWCFEGHTYIPGALTIVDLLHRHVRLTELAKLMFCIPQQSSKPFEHPFWHSDAHWRPDTPFVSLKLKKKLSFSIVHLCFCLILSSSQSFTLKLLTFQVVHTNSIESYWITPIHRHTITYQTRDSFI